MSELIPQQIRNIVCETAKCPIVLLDVPAMQTMEENFGGLWIFKAKDIRRCLAVLRRENHDVFDRIEGKGEDSAGGS